MFDWNKYYHLAIDLSMQNEEAQQRSAISRAYYAAYRLTRDKICRESFEGESLSHANVWKLVCLDRKYALYGNCGFELKKLREKADYEEIFDDIQDECTYALDLANQIIEGIKK